MPQDTIYIPSETGTPPVYRTFVTLKGDTVLLPDSFFRSDGYQYGNTQQLQLQQRKEDEGSSGNDAAVIFIFMLIFVVMIVKNTRTEKSYGGIKRKKIKREDQLATDDRSVLYDNWLKKYNPYYTALPPQQQQLFLFRTVQFLQAKEFRFHSMVEEEYIPVLVSGAAVQITFGLHNYLMDYFPVIHIIRKEYILNVDRETYYGHVSRNGIYISWNRFMEGYEDYTDCCNVGLHEMAHAISYDAFLGEEDKHDTKFKQRLENFGTIGRPVFRALRNGMVNMLDDYAATNFDEFWAVCIENFFEKPARFKESMPELYQSLVELLNQDPLKIGRTGNEKAENLQIAKG
jgi:MtfA peptidase